MRIDLYPHQLEAVEKLGVGSILCGGVGSGKSRTSIAFFFQKIARGTLNVNGVGETTDFKRPMDLYIITTAKKRDSLDWEGECAKFSIGRERDASFCGIKVTVDSWNNIKKYTEVEGAFFIFDEQRLVGKGAWVKSFLQIVKKNEWILLSATPGDAWEDYIPVFIANGFYKNRSQFIARHVVYARFTKYPKVDYYIDVERLENFKRQLLVDMPFGRKTTRHNRLVGVGYDVDKFNMVMKKRWDPYEDKPIAEVSRYFYLMRRVVNSDRSRIDSLILLLSEHDRLVVFYNFNYELEKLRELSDVIEIPIAEWNGHKHEPIPEGDRWIYLVQYTAGAEGWNCTTTDAMVFYSLNYSYRLTHQAEGRIDRLDTPYTDLYYYTLQSSSPIDRAINKALQAKKNFNERNWKKGGRG